MARNTLVKFERSASFYRSNNEKNLRNIWNRYSKGEIDSNTLDAMIRSLKTVKSNRYARARKEVNEEKKRKLRK
jgi:Holliday junction resolvase-like predicted endonuclease